MVTLEVPQRAPMRMVAECDCQPQVEVRYHTVPFDHADSFPLEVMAELLNGRTGRLYKTMVEGRGIASSVEANQDSRKYAGAFSFSGEVKGDATPEQLEQAWYEELERLQREPAGAHELQKVKNQIAADSYRRLESNRFLLIQLGIYASLGDWQYINESPRKLQAVTAEDVQRVAKTYFAPSNSAVAIFTRKAAAEAEDPDLAALDPEARSRVQKMIRQIVQMEDAGRLQLMVSMLETQLGQVEGQDAAAVQYIIKKLNERIAELEWSTTPH